MDYFFSDIIQQVNKIDSSHIRDEIKLQRAGELFYQGSVCLLAQAEAALENARQESIDLTDTLVDSSFERFLASLTQQSITTTFLQKYLKPQSRVKYERGTSVKIQSLTSSEAVSLFNLDLIESEVISLAHDEDINAWTLRVTKFLETNVEISSLPQIAKATDLSITQVFISLLFGANFELVQLGDFYEGLAIEVRSRTS